MPKGIYIRTEKHKIQLDKVHLVNKGRPCSKEKREKISKTEKEYYKIHQQESGMKGKRHSEKTRRKISETLKGKYKGKKNPFWKGGTTPIYKKIRQSLEYKLWRESIFKKDNYTCKMCNIKSQSGTSVYLQAHHMWEFSKFPELRFAINNGITLCEKCHIKIHKKSRGASE